MRRCQSLVCGDIHGEDVGEPEKPRVSGGLDDALEGDKPRRAKAEGKERAPKSDSKQARMIALMQRPQGMTLDEACKAFDWQRHTVRGTIAGALKGKLGLKIDVED